MKKKETKNDKIKVADEIFIKCKIGQGIKIVPLYIKHDTKPDELYYKFELQERNKDTSEWSTLATWNLYQDAIEALFNYISTTSELKTKDSVFECELPEEKSKILKSLVESSDIIELLKNDVLSKENLSNLKNALKITEIENAIDEFKSLLYSNPDREKPFEDWFKENSWAYGNYYLMTEEVHSISNAEKVDALISNCINNYRDIVEFKKPNASVLKYDSIHKNYYFSDDVNKAISQVINYSDIFEETASKGLHRNENIKAYVPKSIIIIGRSNNFSEEQIKALHGLNSRLNNIEIRTYDNLLSQCENLLKQITYQPKYTIIDEDLPF